MNKLKKQTEDLTGRIFKKLTVLSFAGYNNYKAQWLCGCSCGKEVIKYAVKLKSGRIKSCGKCNSIGIGYVSGKLTVIGFYGYEILQCGRKVSKWLCQCFCGNKTTVEASHLKSKHTKSCGNCNPIKIGDRFEKLTVIKFAGYKLYNGVSYKQWLCKCSCGRKIVVVASSLKNGNTKSCGCIPTQPNGGYNEKYKVSYDSLWELNFVKILEYLEVKWEREPKKFKLSNGKVYIPDFYLPEFNMFIEIKGRWFKGSKEKTELFKKEYSGYKYYVIDSPKYRELKKKFKFLLEGN
jgi:hypothetical protein